jgi:hypothetical protein
MLCATVKAVTVFTGIQRLCFTQSLASTRSGV